MSRDTITIEVTGMDLTNLGGDQLQEQFQECLSQIAETFQNYDPRHGGGKVKAGVTVTASFVLDPETNTIVVRTACKVSLPKRRTITSAAQLRNGRFLVAPDDGRQLDAFTFHHDKRPQPVASNQE